MNKKFTKVAALSVGLAMAIGVGVGLGVNSTRSVKAETATVEFTPANTTSWNSTQGSQSQVLDAITFSSDNAANNTQLRLYSGGTHTFTSSAGNITSIVFTCTANGTANYGPGKLSGTGYVASSGKTGTWTGSATSVTVTGGQARCTSIVVTYESGGSVTSHNITYAAGTHGTYDGSTTHVFSVAESAKHTVKSPTVVGITANSGYVFTGWNDGTNDYAVDSEYTMGNSDVTLTAQWAAEVLNNEIVFDNVGTDSGSEVTSADALAYITSGRGYVSSFDNISKVYKGTTGLKFGASGSAGTITFNFDTSKTVDLVGLKMYANIVKFSSDTGNFVFTSSQLTGSPVSVTKPGSLTKTSIGVISSTLSSLTIATSGTRGYLKSLVFETPSGYTVSFNHGDGTGEMSSVYDVTGSYTLPASTFTAPSGMQFAGWKANNTGELIAAGGSYTVSADVTFYAQWEASVIPEYSKITNLDVADKVVITTTKSGSHYYLPAATTSNNPAANACTIVNNKTTNVDATNLFTVTKVNGNYTFVNSDGKYLHDGNANDSVRINSNTAAEWTVTATANGFKMTNNSRWLGVYQTTDWRSYTTSNASNYGGSGEAIEFYGIEKESAPLDIIDLVGYPTSDMAIYETANLSYYGLDTNGDEWTGEVTYTSSDTTVATVDSTGLLTAVGAGTTDLTVYANAGEGGAKVESAAVTITVSNTYAKGTEQNPYTVPEAVAAAATGANSVYTSGIISQVVSFNSTYGSITYFISADGHTASTQLKVFGGLNLNSEQFTSINDLQVGDEVTICGNLLTYQSVAEYDSDNYLTSFNRPDVDLVSISSITGTLSAYSGEPSWDLSTLTVNGVLSNSASVVDVTLYVDLTTLDVPGTVSETTQRNVSVTATGKDDSSITYTGSVVGTINAYSGLVAAGKYRIKATRDEVTYYLQENGTSAPNAVTDFWEATVFTFVLVGNNTYTISTNSGYLYSTDTNNGVKFGTPQTASNKNWTIETGESTLTGAYNFVSVDSGRYLTLYNEQDWRVYTSATAGNRKENTDVQAFNATQFATEFMDTYTAGCNASGTYDPTEMMWTTASTQFSFLSSDDQTALTNASASEGGTTIQQAAAKYDYIVGKYGTSTFTDFMHRGPASIGGSPIAMLGNLGSTESNTILVVSIVAILSIAGVGGYFFLRRRKEQ